MKRLATKVAVTTTKVVAARRDVVQAALVLQDAENRAEEARLECRERAAALKWARMNLRVATKNLEEAHR